MLESYVPILILHMSLAVLSPVLFSMRAWRALRGLDPAAGWLRVTPHLVDTLLLAAGIALALIIGQYPFVNGWLTAKLLALIAYIAVGHVAVRRARTRAGRLGAWLAGIALVAYIFAVAVSRDPSLGLLSSH
jgi:uncharacterized membrane protein SirB2